MKKTILKLFASILVFTGTLFLASTIMNRGNVNTTKEMETASLPIVYMNIGGEDVNELCGYTADMDIGLLRENITPLDEKRGVTFRIEKFGTLINSINVNVRTVDGERLIENIDVTALSEDDYGILAKVTLKDLLEEYTEYSLQICLSVGDGKDVFYHTRVIEAPSYCVNEKLQFVKNFVNLEMSTDTNVALKTYMESNRLGDNTTLEKVNIHSSLEQLAFSNLHVSRITEPVISIKEIASETGMFLVNYLVSAVEDGVTTKYFVEEYYRIKYLPEVTYLLDYERTMHEVTFADESMIRGEDILIGITSEDIPLIESDDGNVIVFSNSGTLISYNISANRFTRLFSFYDESHFDERTYRQDYSVKPLRVDEAGNVWFAVFGYMNRGTYEGKTGIALYYFNGVTSENEEVFFIPSDKPAEVVQRDLDELCYLNSDGVFYIMLDKTIYAVDSESKLVEILVEDLEENKYTVSDDSSLIVWQQGDDVNACNSITLMNLNTKQMSDIKAPEGQFIKPLAFIGEDYVYGLAYKEDIVTDNAGRTTFPMYCVKIQSKFGEVLKQYKEEGVYVTQVSTKGNMLTLTRVSRSEKSELAYVPSENEYITNNQETEKLQNNLNTFTNGVYEKQVRIILKKEVSSKIVKIVPKEVIYEGNRELIFERPVSLKNYFYVYFDGKLRSIYTNPANAVTEADQNYGTVLNENGYYAWYRANRFQRNQIMDLSVDPVPDEVRTALGVCLDMMLGYNGVVRNSDYLLNSGETVLSILREGLTDKEVMDLTGCSLDSILYYVNRDIPVLAMTYDGKAYLIIGFNQMAIVVYDPAKGWYKMGINEAEKLFSESGNRFVTYVPNAS